jgi:predicted dehydrogenase
MPDNLTDKRVLLVGAGPMAVDYAAILKSTEISFDVIGRGEKSAIQFREKTGTMPSVGGLDPFVTASNMSNYSHAIVATGVESLAENAISLIRAGLKKILVEKPGGLNSEEIEKLKAESEANNAEVFIAYNRRFYSSVAKAKEIIENDGGVTSFHFDFTEWSHKIEPLVKAPGVKEAWLLANSTHVIDLAFYLGGFPTVINCYTGGSLSWHKHSIFAGAGVTETGALFSYGANWESAGRWGIELMTKAHKIILRPMEELFIQDKGSVEIKKVEIDTTFDAKFKPGLYLQTMAFLNNNYASLLGIGEQYKNVNEIYLRISGS